MRASLVPDEQFHDTIRYLIARTRETLDICTFVFDLMPDNDTHLAVRRLAHMLKDAADDGVRVRIMVAQPDRGPATVSNFAAALYCAGIGLDSRLAPREAAVHAKYVISDRKRILLGGHNISWRGFATNRDISVLIEAVEGPAVLGFEREFERIWTSCESTSVDALLKKVLP